ncbi:ester cyclase [Pontibacter diazotrophicus]|uniref:Ester cyclase n=1 Tax=Pontibacter diazotrophicus TaxID=1400979 RepID=A0A3D8L6M5_9BACT|nr:ester cyclase [Pontibacter diazotrophicus]RDV12973.1 ester cyclase [Pontibacter diazotrophicus]
MTTEENKKISRRVYEIFSSDNLDALDEMLDRNFIDHYPQPGQGPGIDGVKQMLASLRKAFPDLQWIVKDMVAEDDKVVARLNVAGTHQGMYKGIPATGEQASIPLINIFRIADGKVVERWGVEDQLSLMQQLGSAASSGLARFGKAALAVALPAALVWAWRNDKLPWS